MSRRLTVHFHKPLTADRHWEGEPTAAPSTSPRVRYEKEICTFASVRALWPRESSRLPWNADMENNDLRPTTLGDDPKGGAAPVCPFYAVGFRHLLKFIYGLAVKLQHL